MTPRLIGMALAVTVALASAQTNPAARPEFAVASIKPNSTGGCENFVRYLPGGRLSAENVALRTLIRSAYRVRNFQISGGPAWMNTDGFDVLAKAEDGTSQDQLPLITR